MIKILFDEIRRYPSAKIVLPASCPTVMGKVFALFILYGKIYIISLRIKVKIAILVMYAKKIASLM